MLIRLAAAYDLPVEILLMTDQQFHWWLHNTEAGKELLANG